MIERSNGARHQLANGARHQLGRHCAQRKLVLASVTASLALALSTAPLCAQVPPSGATEPTAARALFREARSLVAKGQYEQACPKFEESQRLHSGAGTLFNWADCLEHVGKRASAWAHYLDVAALAKANGQPEREKVARDRAAAIEPKLARLTIEVRAHDPDLEVLRDGVRVERALWGTAVPIDLGAHRIEARAQSKRRWASTVQVLQDGARATVVVPVLEAGAEPEGTSGATGSGAMNTAVGAAGQRAQGTASQVGRLSRDPREAGASGALAMGPSDGADNGRRKSPKTLSIVSASVGVAATIAGTVLFLQARSNDDAARAICTNTPNACPPEQIAHNRELIDDGRQLQAASIVAFAVGGAALVAGAVIRLTASSSSASSTVLRVQPTVSHHQAGLWLTGQW